jgi:uncharacterized protein
MSYRPEKVIRPALPNPAGAWIMRQVWHDLLFAHWALPPETLRPLVPPQLELDTYDGQAWVAVVPFYMSDIRPRGLFGVSWLSNFAELNVRTYVKVGGKAGVYFFSLDAANPVGVRIARRYFSLPYFDAHMTILKEGNTVHYTCERTHKGAPSALFTADYAPSGEPFHAQAGTLEHFLTERYCFFTLDNRNQVRRGDIFHEPWALQPAVADITFNTMALSHGIVLPDEAPLLHFSRRLDIVAWMVRRA